MLDSRGLDCMREVRGEPCGRSRGRMRRDPATP